MLMSVDEILCGEDGPSSDFNTRSYVRQANSTKRRMVKSLFDGLFVLSVAKFVDIISTKTNVDFTAGTFPTQIWFSKVQRTSFIQSKMKKGAGHGSKILFLPEIENNKIYV